VLEALVPILVVVGGGAIAFSLDEKTDPIITSTGDEFARTSITSTSTV